MLSPCLSFALPAAIFHLLTDFFLWVSVSKMSPMSLELFLEYESN